MANDYTNPVYSIDGREFKTVGGLCKYLMTKHRATEVSGVAVAMLRAFNERGE